MAQPSVCRFYNATLEGVYKACPVQVLPETTVPKPHHFGSGDAENFDDSHSGFTQRDRRVRPNAAPYDSNAQVATTRLLAQPFRRPLPEWRPPTHDRSGAPAAKKRRTRERVGAYRQYKVRMIPTPEQKRELKQCFAAARSSYNWFVGRVENHGEKPNENALKKAFRASNRPEWVTKVASQIVAGGIADAADAYKSNFAKRRLNPGQHDAFTVRFRSHRKTPTESIRIEGDGAGKQSSLLAFRPLPFANNPALRSECAVFFGNNLSGLGERYWDAESPEEREERLALRRADGKTRNARTPQWRTPLGADAIRLQDKPHVIARLLAEGPGGNGNGVVNGCKVHWDKRTDSWFLLYTYELPPLADPDPTFATKCIAATDPGVREFMTWYSPATGNHGELFKGGRDEIERRCARVDALTSQLVMHVRLGANPQPSPHHRRNRVRQMKRTLARERCRLRGYVTAAHYAAANHLLCHHELVVAPKLAVSRMAPRNGRVFGSKTARAMLTFSHGLFTQRLHCAAYRHAGRHVVSDSGEPGTSKTCGDCGHWHATLGADKVFSCMACGTVMSRDLNGARNNFFAAYGATRGMHWDDIHR